MLWWINSNAYYWKDMVYSRIVQARCSKAFQQPRSKKQSHINQRHFIYFYPSRLWSAVLWREPVSTPVTLSSISAPPSSTTMPPSATVWNYWNQPFVYWTVDNYINYILPKSHWKTCPILSLNGAPFPQPSLQNYWGLCGSYLLKNCIKHRNHCCTFLTPPFAQNHTTP